ncbi:hypothetical protein AYO20_11509 [Fonsecaea nubica]|uniref:Fe2OG dioxygenase domain-containing protein n=1 Tax=Fonsecaea nubica TaxID=856822 RepID=A0A178BRU4_9EURO|nr:hypothetical protein AYO20_11509 [Fonsecaea nubica]OAL20358.1 hypothetical protein AYO20_11509 [Fonsecaea nubica]
MPPEREPASPTSTVRPDTAPAESDVLSTPDTADPSLPDPFVALTDFAEAGATIAATCGGSIRLSDFATLVSRTQGIPSSQADGTEKGTKKKGKRRTTMDPSPIVFDWDEQGRLSSRVTFPIPPYSETAYTMTIEAFLKHCDPIVDGMQGDDGHAWTLNAPRVTTNLCPYSMGIVERVDHLLLPNSPHLGGNALKNGGFVRAELHKINVYAGHSGSVKRRIDIPTAENQFGSLFLYLPSEYEGGELTVNHAGFSTEYDCDKTRKSKALHWAAFLSGCEHEISQVTSGFCVIVTYNLYHHERTPLHPRLQTQPFLGLASKPAPVDLTNLAPYKLLQDLLSNPEWLPRGGTLGIHCKHAYPLGVANLADVDETGDLLRGSYPTGVAEASLRGTDASICAVLGELGLDTYTCLKLSTLLNVPVVKWINGPTLKHYAPVGNEMGVATGRLAETSMCIVAKIPPHEEASAPDDEASTEVATKKPRLK